jgi:hypothetical protein
MTRKGTMTTVQPTTASLSAAPPNDLGEFLDRHGSLVRVFDRDLFLPPLSNGVI